MRPTMSDPRRIVVFCDGTWCGPETDTRTNIQMLAEMTGIDMKNPKGKRELDDPERNLKAKYFNGIGLGSTFLAYLFNGATANDIGETCVDIYEYIAQNYTLDAEVWLFGLSRGAYSVRCVVGMINNCGIVKDPTPDLCNQVYNIYSSPYAEDKPGSEQSKKFRSRASWDVRTPIQFMGLLDTVGSIGIPSLDAGNGPSYPTLWDQTVSNSVDKVYHACSLHDRLSLFQPCLTKKDRQGGPAPTIHEEWFPGCHYDIGRQRFKFLRQNVTSIPERLLSLIPNWLSGTLEPNHVLSDLVLHWMLKAINHEYPTQTVISNIPNEMTRLHISITTRKQGLGSGDVYSPQKGLVYFPFGRIFTLLPSPPVLNDAFKLILAIRDRRIPDDNAIIYPYNKPFGDSAWSIAQLGDVTSQRYPSRTYESWSTWSAYFKKDGTVNGVEDQNGDTL